LESLSKLRKSGQDLVSRLGTVFWLSGPPHQTLRWQSWGTMRESPCPSSRPSWSRQRSRILRVAEDASTVVSMERKTFAENEVKVSRYVAAKFATFELEYDRLRSSGQDKLLVVPPFNVNKPCISSAGPLALERCPLDAVMHHIFRTACTELVQRCCRNLPPRRRRQLPPRRWILDSQCAVAFITPSPRRTTTRASARKLRLKSPSPTRARLLKPAFISSPSHSASHHGGDLHSFPETLPEHSKSRRTNLVAVTSFARKAPGSREKSSRFAREKL